jgi:hypothetical protein
VPITDITRQAILDEMNVRNAWWGGRLDDVAFLSRLYPLAELPSYDRRYADAEGDIYQHRVNNNDWLDDWIYDDPRLELHDDEKFLRLLAETVHPAVRPELEQARELVEMYNRHLRPDGFELAEVAQISGRPVYAARSLLTVPPAVRQLRLVHHGDRDYLVNQITRMESAIDRDPELAIGTAKELIETTCKSILVELGVQPERDWDLPRLARETGRLLRVTPDTVAPDAPAAESIRRVLGGLAGVVAGVAELRNQYGTGHGRPSGAGGLRARHARLAVGAASTLAAFLFETYDRRSSDADS